MGIDRYVYAAGDTSWAATFMERLEKQSKGYNAVSLSNYDATAVCVITDGSSFEIAGSVYLCTADTSITASCATGVCYIMATGATATASVAWSTTAPTWRDDLQGYYASAASVVRALGGTYFDGASYLAKWVYGDEHTVTLQAGTSALRPKEYEIGNWDMDVSADGTNFVTIAHGLTGDFRRVRAISVIIRNDTDTEFFSFGDTFGFGADDAVNQLVYLDATNINLYMDAGGYFDTVAFDTATGYNRGWVTLWYGA